MRFPIMTTLMVSALALGTAAHAQQGQSLQPAQMGTDQQAQSQEQTQVQPQDQQQLGQQEQMDQRQPPQQQQIGFQELMDRDVIGQAGDNVGQVSDVLVDADGEVRMIVVEQGGFLGIGGRQVAFDIEQVQLTAEGVRVPVTEEQMDNMPEWDDQQTAGTGWTGTAGTAGTAGTGTGTGPQTQGGQATTGTTD